MPPSRTVSRRCRGKQSNCSTALTTLALSAEDKEDLVKTITSALDKRRSVDEGQHRTDHMWVHDQIRRHQERSRRRAEFHEALKKNVVTWAIISALLGLSALVYGWFEAVVKRLSGQ